MVVDAPDPHCGSGLLRRCKTPSDPLKTQSTLHVDWEAALLYAQYAVQFSIEYMCLDEAPAAAAIFDIRQLQVCGAAGSGECGEGIVTSWA